MQKPLTRCTQCGSLTLLFSVFVVMISLSSTALTTFGVKNPQNQPAPPTPNPAVQEFVPTVLGCANSSEVLCEKVKDVDSLAADLLKKCLLTDSTVIAHSDFNLNSPRDESIESITFAYNKKVEFLPNYVHRVYPNLKIYDAAACAIKSIKKSNFENLEKLKTIYLDGNLIALIDANTFEGLSEIQEIYLSYNKINIIHHNAFHSLTALKRLDLFNNNCINEDFKIDEDLERVLGTVYAKCETQLRSLRMLSDSELEIMSLKAQITDKYARIVELSGK